MSLQLNGEPLQRWLSLNGLEPFGAWPERQRKRAGGLGFVGFLGFWDGCFWLGQVKNQHHLLLFSSEKLSQFNDGVIKS